MDWRELLVKPSIKKIAIDRTREINKSNTRCPNSLYLKQIYFKNLFHQSNQTIYKKNLETNFEINSWLDEEEKNILIHINLKEITESKQIHMYHHEIRKKKVTKSAILELKSEN